jgi:phage gp29-like protein
MYIDREYKLAKSTQTDQNKKECELNNTDIYCACCRNVHHRYQGYYKWKHDQNKEIKNKAGG